MFWTYVGFLALIFVLLALDLGVFHRKAHVVRTREALKWSAVWISLGLSFTGIIYLGYQHHWLGLGTTPDMMSTPVTDPATGVTYYNTGGTAALKYVTGFLIEKSLAVDNIFVIAMVFAFLGVPPLYQHRVLYWGIIGALIMRGTMIGLGAKMIAEFSWILYVFGGFLVLTGVKMFFMDDEEADLNDNRMVRLARRLLPLTERYHMGYFFVRAGSSRATAPATPGAVVETDRVLAGAPAGKLFATPLFLTLMIVEVTDLIFAVDSIPAIFAISTDAFIIFTSNIFAILGLRSLYFALAGMMDTFRYLKVALSFVLVVVGAKMLAHTWLKSWLGEHFNLYMLGLVLGILATGVIMSLWRARHEPPAGGEGEPKPEDDTAQPSI